MPKARLSTAARGYGWAHQQERARWRPVVESGNAICSAPICKHPTRRIARTARWHLGHNPQRTGWDGPQHETCNTSEGATRGNRQRKHPGPPATTRTGTERTSQDW